MTEAITQNAISRLNSSAIDVRMLNGCYMVATAVAEFSRHKSELRVEVTHPLLTWQCGDKKAVELIMWRGGHGRCINVPDELQQLVERMKLSATMPDDEAARVSHENKEAYSTAMRELGFRQDEATAMHM